MKKEADYFEGVEPELIYIAKHLSDATTLESVFTAAGIDYAVEADEYRGGIIFPSTRIGAFFYVRPETRAQAVDVMKSSGYVPTKQREIATIPPGTRLLAYNRCGGSFLKMGPLGTQELVAIFLLALLMFGPKELPKIGRTIGKAMTDFKRAQAELKSTIDREMANIEREVGVQELAATTFKTDNYTYNPYESEYYDEFGSPESPLPANGAFATQSAGSPAPLQVEAATGSIASGQLPAPPATASAPWHMATPVEAPPASLPLAGNSQTAEHAPAESAPKPA